MPVNYQTARLVVGHHAGPDDGVCVMELASMLAGEPFSDHPRSVSPTLAGLLRGYNDGLDYRRRQTLKHYASASVGTARGRTVERERRRLVRAWLADLDPATGSLAAIGRRLAMLDLHHAGHSVAVRVRHDDDSKLHASMLALFDALIAVGAPSSAPAAIAAERDVIHVQVGG
jgi:hypothetical protein